MTLAIKRHFSDNAMRNGTRDKKGATGSENTRLAADQSNALLTPPSFAPPPSSQIKSRAELHVFVHQVGGGGGCAGSGGGSKGGGGEGGRMERGPQSVQSVPSLQLL